MDAFSRRDFIRQAGTGLLTFTLAGCEVELTPGEARRRGIAKRVLTDAEAAALEALGEALLPGSRAAGIAQYVDHQLGEPAARQRLMIKYLGVEPPFDAFYRSGFASVERASVQAAGKTFIGLDEAARHGLVARMARESPPGWGEGPPAPFFFFVVRNDALDVTYGTEAGFAALGIPYMAHVVPPSRWGE